MVPAAACAAAVGASGRDPVGRDARIATGAQEAREGLIAPPLAEPDQRRLVWSVYWSVREALEADGRDWRTANRLATRAARATVLRFLGYEQSEVVNVLGVGKRTADGDLARWRAVVEGLAPDDAGPPPTPLDRIVVARPPARAVRS
jgi:hypothetical protein